MTHPPTLSWTGVSRSVTYRCLACQRRADIRTITDARAHAHRFAGHDVRVITHAVTSIKLAVPRMRDGRG